MNIRAVLFDADGVIQRSGSEWRSAWGSLIDCSDSVDAFLSDVFAAEGPALTGNADFHVSLAQVLTRWHCADRMDEALRIWTLIDADPGVLHAVGVLRKMGVPCYIASNQQPYRARYMSEHLGYGTLFDGEFYSCWLGRMKPQPEYFQAILTAIGLPPATVAFLDDHQSNVDAAKKVGIQAAVFSLEAGAHGLQTVLRSLGVAVRLS